MNLSDEMIPKASDGGRYLNRIEPGGFVKVLFIGDPTGAIKWSTVSDDGECSTHLAHLLPDQEPQGVDMRIIWLAPVFDLRDGRKKLWSISQKPIQQAVSYLAKDEDYDLVVCPVKVSRKGNDKYSFCTADALPPIELTEEQKAEAATPCDPIALFHYGAPFEDCDPPDEQTE